MDRAWKLLSSRMVCAAVVLVAACLLAGCGLAMVERQTGDADEARYAEERADGERAVSAGEDS